MKRLKQKTIRNLTKKQRCVCSCKKAAINNKIVIIRFEKNNKKGQKITETMKNSYLSID